MADVVSPSVRSRMMAGIRGKDTKPELIVRRGLHARGLRFVLHDKRLPGRPDLVLPRFRTAIQVHGCFWHGHGCRLFRWPGTRVDFWKEKISGNMRRDERDNALLSDLGWKVLTVWECEMKGASERELANLLDGLERKIRAEEKSGGKK